MKINVRFHLISRPLDMHQDPKPSAKACPEDKRVSNRPPSVSMYNSPKSK